MKLSNSFDKKDKVFTNRRIHVCERALFIDFFYIYLKLKIIGNISLTIKWQYTHKRYKLVNFNFLV